MKTKKHHMVAFLILFILCIFVSLGPAFAGASKKKKVRRFVFGEFGRPVDYLRKLAKKYPKFDPLRYNRELKFIRSRNFKYIWASDGRDELYHVEKDPEELHNLIKEGPKKAKEMRRELKKWLSSLGERASERSISLDKETLEKLRSLGYMH